MCGNAASGIRSARQEFVGNPASRLIKSIRSDRRASNVLDVFQSLHVAQVEVRKGCVPKHCLRKVRASDVSSYEAHRNEIRPFELRSFEIRVAEVHPFEVRLREVSSAEVRLAWGPRPSVNSTWPRESSPFEPNPPGRRFNNWGTPGHGKRTKHFRRHLFVIG
jgi:hypothetical protein